MTDPTAQDYMEGTADDNTKLFAVRRRLDELQREVYQ